MELLKIRLVDFTAAGLRALLNIPYHLLYNDDNRTTSYVGLLECSAEVWERGQTQELEF